MKDGEGVPVCIFEFLVNRGTVSGEHDDTFQNWW